VIRRRLSDVAIQVTGMSALLVALALVTWSVNSNFLSAYSLQTLSRDVAILALFALGQGIVIISGGIDLSVGSLVCFIGLTTMLLLSPASGRGWPLAAVLPLALAVAALIGTLQGLFVSRLNLQPFMVTLCSLLIFRSVARGLTGDTTVSFRPSDLPRFDWLGNGLVVGVPVPVWILLAATLLVLVLMRLTVFGSYLYAIGFNLEAARFSGVRIHTLRTAAFTLSALLAGVAGILEASAIRSVAPSSSGIAYELHGITAAVLGGCALRGGRGSIVGIVVGAAVLKVLQRMIVFLGLETHWTDAVVGLVLLVAVVSDALVKRRRAGKTLGA
jgi:ribose transport system permease protein